ncbi:QRFP-like peptide receptor [Actinia tenebrosa]|uniref:QRFP-like peptide receptor n=1 Tax=Actinia tenebrosa TaxID=6105 RepID=A0A6P8I445_ACTTE|nr:QRFP-like peptide receptor [Actinia tenebrosa]XP_031563335.1 QRFP-like peptide receptor [Actinia tenebrosa]XP_031563336.1 QRFP-like peptide receptor [Actinia tenebrosa]XP_031563337.1 QRFP-like peptide receptor [Actinia tenebrosa]
MPREKTRSIANMTANWSNPPRVDFTAMLNQTASDSEESFDVSVVQLMCFPLIIAFGLIGNTLICVAVRRRSRLRIIDCFILNLAATDLATCMISIPFDFVEVLTGNWPFGSILCKVVYPLQTILISVSVYTLLCMSLERRRTIIRPFKPKVKIWRVFIVILILWVFSVFLVAPYIAILDVGYTNNSSDCQEHWPENTYAKAYTLSLFIVIFLLPLFAITANYVTISSKLWKDIERIRKAIGEVPSQGKKHLIKARAQRNMRIVKIFVLAVVVFGLCMVPYHIMWIWHDYGSGSHYKHFGTILVFCNILTYSNSAINPFIFVFLHSRYCKDILALLPCGTCRSRLCIFHTNTSKKHFKNYTKKKRNAYTKRTGAFRRRNDPNARDEVFYHGQPWSNTALIRAEAWNAESVGKPNRQRLKSWRRICQMEYLKEAKEGEKDLELNIEPVIRPRKPRVNFGGERIIHIDEYNNVEMESAI